MLNFLWQIICFVWGAFLFFVSLLSCWDPVTDSYEDWDEEEGLNTGKSGVVGRTCVGSVEPSMTTAWGETVGRMSGSPFK